MLFDRKSTFSWSEMACSRLAAKALLLVFASFLLLGACASHQVKIEAKIDFVKKTHYFENVRYRPIRHAPLFVLFQPF